MAPSEIFAVVLFTFVIPVGWLFAVPLVKKWRRDLERKSAGGVDLEALFQELAQLRERVLELEERVDFAERLMSQIRDRERLPGAR